MATDDFFRARLDLMIDMRHPLSVLVARMHWAQIEASLAPLFVHRHRPGHTVLDSDLFGVTADVVGAGINIAGRPRLPIRLMVALLYLKHVYNESDESVVQRWAHDVYFQFFSGQDYFEPRLPYNDSQIGRFRQVLGEAGVEQLLKTTIEAAVDMRAIKRSEFERVIVDMTVQQKAVAHPSDSRLLEVARAKIAQLATRAGIKLKQSYAREGQQLRRRAGGYAHARQFKRLHRVLRRQRVILGRLLRDFERKITDSSRVGLAHPTATTPRLEQAVRAARARGGMHRQGQSAPAVRVRREGQHGRHAQERLGRRRAQLPRQPVRRPHAWRPDRADHHAAARHWRVATTAVVDLGYRGVDHLVPINIIHRGRYKTMTEQRKRWLKRR